MDNTQSIKLILTADGSGLNGPVAASTRELEKLENQAGSLTSRLDGIAKTGISVFLGSTLVSSAMSASKALYEASAQGQRLRTMLDYATGGKSVSEMIFITDTANRLGLEITSTAKAYGGFAAATRGTALEGEKTRRVFESVAKASAVMGLSADETRGVLLSLQQMVSKGTVQAEELRGQLGERLPGAFRTAAEAMGVTESALGKMLEQGQVVADDFLPKFAAALDAKVGRAAEDAAKRLDGSVNLMGNAWEKLKQTIGDSGVSSALASSAGALTNDMQAITDAMNMAKASGGGFLRQMNDGLGMVIGRSLGLQNVSREFLTLEERVTAADANLAALRKKAAEGWGVNIYFKADLASARAEVEALQALQIAMGQKVAGAGRGDASKQLNMWADAQRQFDPYTGAKSLDDVRKDAKLRQDIQREEGAKAVEIAKSFGAAIATAGEGSALAVTLATERDERLKALRRDTHKALDAYDKEHADKLSKSQQAELTAYGQLTKKIGNDFAKAYADAQAEAQGLNKAQEEFLATAASPEWLKFTQAQRAHIAALYETKIAQHEADVAAKASVALKRELAKIEQAATVALLDESASIADHVKKLQAETAAIGLSKARLAELEVARTEEALANAEATLATKLATGAKADEIEAVTMLVEELRKLRTAQKDNAAKTAAQDAANEWQQAAESIQGSITDALMRAFESGKGFAMAFRDTIANAFKTMVLQPAINTLVGTFGSMLGMSGASASTIGSALGSASAGSSMLGSIGAALGLGSMSGLGGIFSMGAQLTGFTGAGTGMALQGAGAMMGNGSIMQGLAQGAGALAPWALGGAAGIYGGRAISGGYGSNATVNIGTAIGAAIAGPIGAALGGVAGGILNRAFGMGSKNTTEQGLQGSFGGGAATGKAYANWHQDGGWFRSDKNGTNLTALDAATQEALNAGAAAVLAQSQGWAKALKLPAEQLAGITSSFKIKLTTDAEANKQAVADAITAYQGSLTGSISALLKPFQKAGEDLTNTFSRLATLQTFSASLNELGGVFHTLANLSVSARENIIALSGGMDALSQQAMGFAQNYYTRDEIAGLKAKEIQGALAGAGITQDIGTKEQFRALVEGLDLSTAAGQQQLATLLGVQGDFSAVADYIGTSGGTLAGTANLAPTSGPLASLFGDQANAQVNAINGVASGIDLVRQSIEYLTDVVKSTWGGGKAALPTKPGSGNWEVSLP